jgi:alpha-amylase
MGFDAIWISPVIDNTQGGYHGYWAQDLWAINSNFGTAEDLKALVAACHSRKMWVMLDVVGNHMGYGAPGPAFAPLSDPSHYHQCDVCPSDCNIDDFTNMEQVVLCRLAGLPDLNQTNPIVQTILTNWVSEMVTNYSLDGLRIDTVLEVENDFWGVFKAASGVYTVGEIDNGDVQLVSSYQAAVPGTSAPGVDGTLSYPLYFTLRNVFASQQSLTQLSQSIAQCNASFVDMSLLGTFIDNHDNPRFLSTQQDLKLYIASIVYVLMAEGIPIIYYGTEQEYSGGNDPDNRETLWASKYATSSPIYSVLKTVNAHRAAVGPWQYNHVQRYVDDSFYAFTRGLSFVALTNVGTNGGQISRPITYHPYQVGTVLCNIFYPTQDCINVTAAGFVVDLDSGESKIYTPM